MNGSTCPLCEQAAKRSVVSSQNHLQDRWKCETCGTFNLDPQACLPLEQEEAIKRQRFLLSAHAKEGPNVLIDLDLLDRLRQGGLREKTVPEKMELVLRYFAEKSRLQYGQEVPHNPKQDYPFAWCRSSGEWSSLIGVLASERQLLTTGNAVSACTVTMKGWEWLGARPCESGKTAFVAMNFDEKYQDLQKEIERAIRGAGYEPKVASKDLYAGGVMDWVLAQIREARFVVADYTDNRGGVYYEAGFALGLGKTVIHSCRKQMLDPSNKNDRLHFDVAHLKVIPWNDGDLSAYSADLENHILAVLGRGPVKPQPLP